MASEAEIGEVARKTITVGQRGDSFAIDERFAAGPVHFLGQRLTHLGRDYLANREGTPHPALPVSRVRGSDG